MTISFCVIWGQLQYCHINYSVSTMLSSDSAIKTQQKSGSVLTFLCSLLLECLSQQKPICHILFVL